MSFENLVKRPPAGFEYIRNFYKSCTMGGTGWTTEESLFEEEVRAHLGLAPPPPPPAGAGPHA